MTSASYNCNAVKLPKSILGKRMPEANEILADLRYVRIRNSEQEVCASSRFLVEIKIITFKVKSMNYFYFFVF